MIWDIENDNIGLHDEEEARLLQFDEELLSKLDQYATDLDRSRSAVVLDAVARYIKTESETEKDRRSIEGYTRIPDTGEFDALAMESGRRMVKRSPGEAGGSLVGQFSDKKRPALVLPGTLQFRCFIASLLHQRPKPFVVRRPKFL